MPNWKKVIVSGSNAVLNNITSSGNISASGTATFNSLIAAGLTYPTTDGDDGNVLMTDGEGGLTLQSNVNYITVKNVHGSTLAKGTPVHATGTNGNTPEVIAASSSVAASMPATFVLAEQLTNGSEGRAILSGFLNGINTSNGFTEGDVLYVAPDGGYTPDKPTGTNLIQNIAIIGKTHASNGSIFVYGSGRSNDTQNLLENHIFFGSGSDQQYQLHISGALDSTVINNITASGNISASGDFTGNSFIKGGGTSAQFLKADGSVDSTAYTTNTGTVTNVTVGTGLDVSNGTTTPSITLDLSELTDMTSTMASTDEFIVLDNGAERRKAINEIGLNLFSNNAGFLTRADLTRDVINTLPIANGGTGATTAGAALTALGAAASNHNHDASDINNGTLAEARIPDDMDAGKVKQICTTHHNFYKNGSNQNNTYYFPFNSFNEGTNTGFYYLRTVAPYNGRIAKIVARADADLGSSTRFRVHVIDDTSANFSLTPTEQVTVDMSTANTGATGTFTNSSHFSAGDAVGVGIRFTNSTNTGNIYATVVWEYTL